MICLVWASRSVRWRTSSTLSSRRFCASSSACSASSSASFSSAARRSMNRWVWASTRVSVRWRDAAVAQRDERLVADQHVHGVEEEGDVVEAQVGGPAARIWKNCSEMKSRSAMTITFEGPRRLRLVGARHPLVLVAFGAPGGLVDAQLASDVDRRLVAAGGGRLRLSWAPKKLRWTICAIGEAARERVPTRTSGVKPVVPCPRPLRGARDREAPAPAARRWRASLGVEGLRVLVAGAHEDDLRGQVGEVGVGVVGCPRPPSPGPSAPRGRRGSPGCCPWAPGAAACWRMNGFMLGAGPLGGRQAEVDHRQRDRRAAGSACPLSIAGPERCPSPPGAATRAAPPAGRRRRR